MIRQPILALLLAGLAAPAAAGGVVQTQAVQTPQLAPGFSLQTGAAPIGASLGLSPLGGGVSLGTVLPSVKGPLVQPAPAAVQSVPTAVAPAASAVSQAAPSAVSPLNGSVAVPTAVSVSKVSPAAVSPLRGSVSRSAPSSIEHPALRSAARSASAARDARDAEPAAAARASLGAMSLRLQLPAASKAVPAEAAAAAAAAAWDGASYSRAQGRELPAAGAAGMRAALSGLSKEAPAPLQASAPIPAPAPAPAAPVARPWLKGALLAAGVLAGVIGLFAGAQFLIASVGAAGVSGLSAGSVGLSVLAGVLSFLSPCTLPLIPGYISMISGTTRGAGPDGKSKASSLATGLASIAFVAGFAVVFTALGASATSLGSLLFDYMPVITKVAGGVVAVFGAHLLLSSFGKTIPFISDILYREKRFHTDKVKAGLLGAFLMGMAFAFGWTPCIGPILGGILSMAATQETVAAGTVLLAAYSLGLGIPFILTGFAVEKFNAFFSRYKRFIGWGERASGLILLLLGLLIASNSLATVMRLLGLG